MLRGIFDPKRDEGIGEGRKLHNEKRIPLTPNDPYRGRTAPLTSQFSFYIFIQEIYVLNILNMVYTLRFFLFKTHFVHNCNIFRSCIIHILYTGVLK